MKSVVLVAFSGSWFWSSLTSRLRKSLELSDEDAELVELVVLVVVAAVDTALEIVVMAQPSCLRRMRRRTRVVW